MLPALGNYAQAPVAAFSATPVSGCAPLTVNFTDQSSNSPKFWNWDFGNGSLSNLQNPTIVYSTPGTYTVTLVVRNSDGTDGITKTDLIVVNPSPQASFTADITTGCVPVNIHFTDHSDPVAGSIVSWQWDFGDGNTSTQQSPQNNYTATGFYTVSLVVKSSTGCSNSSYMSRYIRIVPGVTPDFTFTNPITCRPPFAVNFTDQTSAPGNILYLWDFGDGNSSALQNPSNSFGATGSYNVKLTAVSDFGCSGTVQKQVNIVGTTTAITGPTTACLNSPVSFTNNSAPSSLTSFWDFGNGAQSTKTNDGTTYTTPGTYHVRLINTYGFCTDSAFQDVVVLAKPTVDFTANNLTSCKAPFTTTFQDLSPGAVSWNWDFGDGVTSTLQNPTHTYNVEGSYNVTLSITDSKGCSNTITKNTFIQVIKPAVSITNIPAGICVGNTYNFTSSASSIDGIASYAWDFGDGATASGAGLTSPSHAYSTVGTYTVTLTITTTGGCQESATIVGGIKVGNPPAVTFTATPLNTCPGNPISFTGVSATADTWLWDFGDGSTDGNNPTTHAYSDDGTFTVRLIAFSNGCARAFTRANYITIPPPISKFDFAVSCTNKRQVTFTNLSKVNPALIPAPSYVWDFGDGSATSNAVNPVHIYPGDNSYTVTLTVTNGGCSHSSNKTVNITGDIADFNISKSPACKNENITLTAINSNPATSTYSWTINGSGMGGNSNSVSTSFPNAGIYSVSLQITDLNGCSDTKTVANAISITGPTANFSVGSGGQCGTTPVIFNDLSTPPGTITKWTWNFGDGQTQSFNSAPFSHQYSDTGSFNPILTVQDLNGCTDSFTIPTKVLITKSAAKFGSDYTTICPNVNVQFSDSSAGYGLTYLWTFGDGTNSTQQNPAHSFATGNPYTVKLFITDVGGCSDSVIKSNYITVKAPKPAFDISDTTTICPPIETKFTFRGQDYQSFSWDFGDGGVSTLLNPSHFYNGYGSFTAKLYVYGYGGCVDSIMSPINVYNPYTTTGMTYSPLTACNSLLVSFGVTVTPSTKFSISYGDGAFDTSGSKTLQHFYGSPGFYAPAVFLTDNQGCQTTVGGPNTIRVIGSEPFFSEDKKAFCDTGTVNFTNFTIGNDPVVTRIWDFGDGTTSPAKDPSHTYTIPGTFIVSQSVTTQTGCSQTISDTIRVYGTPHPVIASDTVVCIDKLLALLGQLEVADTAITWNWDLGNGNTSTNQNATVSYPKDGNYTVKLTATNKLGCKDDTTKTIFVPPTPVISIAADPTIIVGTGITIPVTYSPNIATYLWTPSKALSCTDCPNPFANPKQTAKYNIKVTDIYGCEASRDVTVIVVCNGKNYFIPNTFSPNGDGVNDIFAPRGVGIARINRMQIFNRWGQIVFEKRNFVANDRSSAGGWDGTFNGKPAPADVYVYTIEFVCENSAIIPYTGNVALIR